MKFRLLLIAAFISQQALSQSMTGIPAINKTNFVTAPVPPEAAAFQKYTDVPVNMSGGIPDIKVPVYTFQLKNFTWDVSFTYHAGGIRVADIAGNAGLGWTLNYGGMISSKMMGQNDLLYGNSANTLRRDLNLLTSHINPTATCTYSNSDDIIIAEFAADGYNSMYMPDIFYLNTNTINAKFFLDADGELSTMPASDTKISYSASGTTITWHVVDDRGNQYYFDQSGGTSSFMGACGGISGSNNYYLTKIVTFFGEEIHFNYSALTYSYASTPTETKYVKPPYPNTNPCSQVSTMQGDGMMPPNSSCNVTMTTTEKVIESIVCSNGQRLVFSYSTRNDVPSAKKLDQIQLYDDIVTYGNLKRTIKCNFSYFSAGSAADDMRLKLDEVSYLNGTATENSYKFEYNSTQLPNRLSKSIDGGGFYNGAGNSTLVLPAADRSSNLWTTKACVLEKVIYPTGGYVEYEYELNNYRGGLRVKQTNLYDRPGSSPIVKSYAYENPQFSGYSLLDDYSIYFVRQITDTDIPELVQCSFFKYVSEPIGESPYVDASIQYGKVTEFVGVNGANGKTVYEFANSEDVMPGTFDITNFGTLLKKKTVYSYNTATSSFEVLQTEENEYRVIKDDNPNYYASSIYDRENRTWGLPVTYVHDEFQYSAFVGAYCYPKLLWQGRLRLISAPVLLFKNTARQNEGAEVLETITEYGYGPTYNLAPVEIKQTNSKGQQVITKMYYPNYLPSFTTYGLTNTEILAYDQLVSANHLPLIAVERSVAGTITGRKITAYDNTVFPNPSREVVFSANTMTEETKIQKKDSYGNIEQVVAKDGVPAVYKWGYKGNYLVAEVRNATDIDIAYSSFEDATKGNWSYTGAPHADATAPTGKQAYSLSQSNITTQSTLSSAKKFKVTYWAKTGSGTALVNGVAATLRVTKNGWSLYEASLSNTTSVTISGTATIDELRLHPGDAQMNTFTYEPLVGITTQCDLNSRISYYEYDNFHRLKLIRDQDGNILKTFEYKYQQQQ